MFCFLDPQILPGSAGRLEIGIASFTEIPSERVIRKPPNTSRIIRALSNLVVRKYWFYFELLEGEKARDQEGLYAVCGHVYQSVWTSENNIEEMVLSISTFYEF